MTMPSPDRIRARNLVLSALKALKQGKPQTLTSFLNDLINLSTKRNVLVRTSCDQAAIDAAIVRLLGAVLHDGRWRLELKRNRRGNPATYEPERKELRRLETQSRHQRILHQVFALQAEKLNKGVERLRRGEKISDRAINDYDDTYRRVARKFSVDWKTIRRLSQQARRKWPENPDVDEPFPADGGLVPTRRKRKRNSTN